MRCIAEDEELRRSGQEEQAREMNEQEESAGISCAATSQSVVMVTAENVREHGRAGSFPDGLIHTQTWQPGQTLSLPVKAGAGCRIAFAIEGSDVMLVQECVDPELELRSWPMVSDSFISCSDLIADRRIGPTR